MPEHQRCPSCEYNLQGTAADAEGLKRCPECGREYTGQEMLSTTVMLQTRHDIRRWALVAMLPSLVCIVIMLSQYPWRSVFDMDATLVGTIFNWMLLLPVVLGLLRALREIGFWSQLLTWIGYVAVMVVGNYVILSCAFFVLWILDLILGRAV